MKKIGAKWRMLSFLRALLNADKMYVVYILWLAQKHMRCQLPHRLTNEDKGRKCTSLLRAIFLENKNRQRRKEDWKRAKTTKKNWYSYERSSLEWNMQKRKALIFFLLLRPIENKQKEANLNAKTDQILQTNKFCMNEKIQKNKAKEKPKLVRQWRLYTSLPIRYYSNFLSTFVVASPEIRFSFCHSARVNQSITTLFLSLSLFISSANKRCAHTSTKQTHTSTNAFTIRRYSVRYPFFVRFIIVRFATLCCVCACVEHNATRLPARSFHSNRKREWEIKKDIHR